MLTLAENLINVHQPGTCKGEYCPFHNPSDHPHKDKPLAMYGKHMVRVDKLEPYGFLIDPDDYEYNRQGYALVMNRILCRECRDTPESEYRHDFRRCECGESFVDGGQEYSRYTPDTAVFIGLYYKA